MPIMIVRGKYVDGRRLNHNHAGRPKGEESVLKLIRVNKSLLNFFSSHPNGTKYVNDLIREDMEKFIEERRMLNEDELMKELERLNESNKSTNTEDEGTQDEIQETENEEEIELSDNNMLYLKSKGGNISDAINELISNQIMREGWSND